MDGGADSTTLLMYLKLLSDTLKNGKDGKFYVTCILTTINEV